MEILIFLLVGILLVVGIIGSIIPVIPGPPISYAAVLLMHFFTPYQFDSYLLMTLASIVVFVTFLDYWLQIEGVKRFGGGKKATNGTIFGLLVGIFIFPPIVMGIKLFFEISLISLLNFLISFFSCSALFILVMLR